ncbi:hypothetical protein GCM10027347_17790 [Larkinella harenae]
MASRKIDDLDPVLAYAFGKAEAEWKLKFPESPQPFLTCTYRSPAEQDTLFAQVPKVTNARAGQSPHNYELSMAFDVAFKKPNGVVDWSNELFTLFSKLVLKTPGITWGGSFRTLKDLPHFERTNWQKLVTKKP